MKSRLALPFILMQCFCLSPNARAAFAATSTSAGKVSIVNQLFHALSSSQIKHKLSGNRLSSLKFHKSRSPFILRGGSRDIDDPFKKVFSASVLDEISEVADKSASFPVTSNLTVSTFADIVHVNTTPLTRKGQHRVLFVLGGPGAGKGTQCEKMIDYYKACHLSVGELLRDAEKNGSEHAALIQDCLVSGKIVPVEISLALVREAMDKIDSSSNGDNVYGSRFFLVDGFPRNFDNLLGWGREMPQYAALFGSLVFDCPKDELERRILSRGLTSGRSDDNIESARKRFKTFETQTVPVVKSLESVQVKDGGILRVVHLQGQKSIDEVWEEVKEVMDGYVLGDILSANQRLIDALNEGNHEAYDALCDYDRAHDSTSEEKMNKNEKLELNFSDSAVRNVISNANANIIKGTEAVVSYDRIITDKDNNILSEMRETRVWHHGKNGWVNVHYIRKSLN